MSNSDALIAPRDGATIEASSPVPTSSGVVSVSGGLVRELSRGWTFTDRQLALLLSAGLFVIGAWPLALTTVPPYQDLPNHLAAVTVISNAEKYPEFVFNGFIKTNAALFAWLYFVGKVTGLHLAARLFSLMVLAANAFVLPRFVLAFTRSRSRMVIASLFCWPLVHNWFVSMGMLDFALAVPLSLGLLLAIDAHHRHVLRGSKSPRWGLVLLVSLLGAATWYAHVFPLLVIHLLVFIEAARQRSWRARRAALGAMALPLLPVTALVAMSLFEHFRDHVGPMTAFVHHKKLAPPWELIYNLWAEWFWGFTKLSITSIVPCFFLVYYAFKQRREAPAFFSSSAILALAVLYCFTPYKITNWYHVNSRLIPFIWLALLLRVPDRLPKRLVAVLGLSALLYSAGMGADFARLEQDRERFTAGVASVPEGASLLPLIFQQKGTSENTRSILHAWGFYVTEKHTSAPLLFAHSRSFPVMYSTPPPVRFNQLLLENFASTMKSAQTFCESLPPMSVADCNTEYRARWAEFWTEATPRFDHLLLWEPTADALSLVPPAYDVSFRQGGLVMMARKAAASPDPRTAQTAY